MLILSLLKLPALMITSLLTGMAWSQVPEIPISNRFVDYGGLIWSGGIQTYTVPEGQTISLEHDSEIIADRLEIYGTILTSGYQLKVTAAEIVWGPAGKIIGFDENNKAPDAPEIPSQNGSRPQTRSTQYECSSDAQQIQGLKGRNGIQGKPGFAGLGYTCNPEDPLCRSSQSRPAKGIQLFTVESFGSSPKIDGTGQTGGDGGIGGQGQNGGNGARGFNAFADCWIEAGKLAASIGQAIAISSFDPVSFAVTEEVKRRIGNGRLDCANKAGPGGRAGYGGMGGPGGKGGAGGAPLPIEFSIGYFDWSRESKNQTNNYQESFLRYTEFTSRPGKPGAQGSPGDIGHPGLPGNGGNGARSHIRLPSLPSCTVRGWEITCEERYIDLCKIDIEPGTQGQAISSHQYQVQQNENLNTTNSLAAGTERCAIKQRPNGTAYRSCLHGEEFKIAHDPITKKDLSQLSLMRNSIESKFIDLHWIRLFDYLLVQSASLLKNIPDADGSYCADESSRQTVLNKTVALRKALLSTNANPATQNSDIPDDQGQRLVAERIQKLWQKNFFLVLDEISNKYEKYFTQNEKKAIDRARIQAANLTNRGHLQSVDLIKALKKTNIQIQSLISDLSEKCSHYQERAKASELQPVQEQFFTLPACEQIAKPDFNFPYANYALMKTKKAEVNTQGFTGKLTSGSFVGLCPIDSPATEPLRFQMKPYQPLQLTDLRYLLLRPLNLDFIRETYPNSLGKPLDDRGQLTDLVVPVSNENEKSLGIKITHAAWLAINYKKGDLK